MKISLFIPCHAARKNDIVLFNLTNFEIIGVNESLVDAR